MNLQIKKIIKENRLIMNNIIKKTKRNDEYCN